MISFPAISVLMTAYNAEAMVGRAIESILSQDFEDFEFIIVNDGSEDGTLGVIESYASSDSRIRVLDQANMGLVGALNRGLREARGEFIARIDADDIALSHRLGVQHDLMSGSEDIVLVGGISSIHSGRGVNFSCFYDEDKLRKVMFFREPFIHSVAMYRRDVALGLGGYDERFFLAEDFDFWIRMSRFGRVLMVPDILVEYYALSDGLSLRHHWKQRYVSFRARWHHNSGFRKLSVLFYSFYSIFLHALPLPFRFFLGRLKRRFFSG